MTTGERIGYERGKQEQGQALILRQLQRRVGELPEEVRGQIQTLSLEQLVVYHLRSEGNALNYEKVSYSEEVKGIDLDLLLRCINIVNHVDAIKTFQQALQK